MKSEPNASVRKVAHSKLTKNEDMGEAWAMTPGPPLGQETAELALTFSPALKGGDSFSLVASYTGALMRMPPHTRRGRHRPNYWA